MVAGPYGIGYGLGQMADQVPQGIMAGHQYGLQLQKEQTDNAQAQIGLQNAQRAQAGQQADDAAMRGYQQPAATETDPDDPGGVYGNALADQHEAVGQQLMNQGYGKEGMAHMQMAQTVRDQQDAMTKRRLTIGSNMLRSDVGVGDMDGFVRHAKAMGFKINGAAQNPADKESILTMDEAKMTNPDGDPNDPSNYSEDGVHVVPKNNVMQLDATPNSWMQMSKATMSLKQQKDLKQQQLDEKKSHDIAQEAYWDARVKASGLTGDKATAMQKNVSSYAKVLVDGGMPQAQANQEAWSQFRPGAGAAANAGAKGTAAARDAEIKRMEAAGVNMDPTNAEYKDYTGLVADRKAAAKKAPAGPAAPQAATGAPKEGDHKNFYKGQQAVPFTFKGGQWVKD